MPMIQGTISREGAIVSVRVGVSQHRRAAIERVGFRVPEPVDLWVLVDTGSMYTGLAPFVFEALEIPPVGVERFSTPSTQPGTPHEADVYDISLSLIFGTAPGRPLSLRSICCLDFDNTRNGSLHGIIGLDVLRHCQLWWLGPDQRFELGT